MTMDIIDKRIYSCNEAICKNIESLQANERGLLSQNILSQLRNFLECVFLKIYVASGNSLIENEYQNIKNAIKFINTLQGKYRFLNQFHKLLQISVSHYTLDPDSSERLMLKYIIRKSKFPQNPKRSVRFSGKRTKRSVQKRKARNTQKAETKVL